MSEYTDADAPDEGPPPEMGQHDMLAEQSVIGSIMMSQTALEDVLDVMHPSDFYQPRHELIARAVVALFRHGKPTDAVAVADYLREAGDLTRAGGDAYLWKMLDVPATSANAGYYAGIVNEMAVRRRLVEKGTRIVAMGNSSEGAVAELVDRAHAELADVVVSKRGKLHRIGDTFDRVVESLEQQPEYMPTPWEALDKLIGGFAPGELVVIAARPGSGKSIALLQCAAKSAHTGVVALSSLEMTEEALQLRLISQYGPVHMTQLRKHQLSKDDWKRVAEARAAVREAPIFVDDTPGVNLSQIRAHVRQVARTGKLVAVYVDYLQLVDGEGQSRQEVVGKTAEGLKALAKDFRVPVIAAAQLKRAAPMRGKNKLPTLDDLRESGGIEQAADVVLLFDRDKEKTPRDLTVVVAKNRSGEQGKFTLAWQAEFARLKDKKWTPMGLFEESEIA